MSSPNDIIELFICLSAVVSLVSDSLSAVVSRGMRHLATLRETGKQGLYAALEMTRHLATLRESYQLIF